MITSNGVTVELSPDIARRLLFDESLKDKIRHRPLALAKRAELQSTTD